MATQSEEQKKAQQKVIKGCAGCIVVMVVIAVVLGVIIASTPSKPDKPSLGMAMVLTEEIVKSQLMFPETADFGNQSFWLSENSREYENTFELWGWVTAKNGFGVPVKFNWFSQFQYIGAEGSDTSDVANWKLLDFRME